MLGQILECSLNKCSCMCSSIAHTKCTQDMVTQQQRLPANVAQQVKCVIQAHSTGARLPPCMIRWINALMLPNQLQHAYVCLGPDTICHGTISLESKPRLLTSHTLVPQSGIISMHNITGLQHNVQTVKPYPTGYTTDTAKSSLIRTGNASTYL